MMIAPMITNIARKERLEMWRDGRFRLVSILLLALLAVALLAGLTRARTLAHEQQTAQESMREFWVDQGAKNPHSAAHYGIWVFKPTLPLSFVDHGVDDYTGITTWLEAHRQNEFSRRPAMDRAGVARFGEWTAATVLQLLIPLLIVMLAFPAFAGERETGTLRQLMALGVPMRTLMLGKALGLVSALMVVLVPAVLLGAAVLLLGTGMWGAADASGVATGSASGSAGDHLARYGLLVVTYLAYFTIVLAFALAVSARSRSVRAALLVLLGAWTVTSLVAPRAAADLARHLYATPSSATFQAGLQRDIDQGLDGHNPADVRRKAVEAQALQEYRAVSLDALPVNFDAIAMQASEEYANQVFDRHFGALYDTYRAQNQLVQWAGAVSPLLAVRSLSMGVAGTDVEQHRDFATHAEAYRRGLVKWSNDYLRDNTRTGEWDWKAPPDVWAQYPAFTYTTPSVSASLTAQWPAMLVLAAWLLIAVVLFVRVPNPRVS